MEVSLKAVEDNRPFWERCITIRALRSTLHRLFLLRWILEEHEDLFTSVMAPLTLLFRRIATRYFLRFCNLALYTGGEGLAAITVLEQLREPRVLLERGKQSGSLYAELLVTLVSAFRYHALSQEEVERLDTLYLSLIAPPRLSYVREGLKATPVWTRSEWRIGQLLFKHLLYANAREEALAWNEVYKSKVAQQGHILCGLTAEEMQKVSTLCG
jgi:hypothetical protein